MPYELILRLQFGFIGCLILAIIILVVCFKHKLNANKHNSEPDQIVKIIPKIEKHSNKK